MKKFISSILYVLIAVFFVYSMVSCYDAEVKVTKKRDFPHYTLEEIELSSLDQKEHEKVSTSKTILVNKHSSNSSARGNFQTISDDNGDVSEIIADTNNSEDINSSYTGMFNPNPNSNSSSYDPSSKYLCSNPYLPPFIGKLSLSEIHDLNDPLIKNVCNNTNYHKFFEKGFGWRGDSSDKTSFVKIFRQKQLSSIKFEFIIGMSFLLPKTEGAGYLADIYKAYTDASWFQTHYVHPDNIKIKLEKINRPLDQKGFDISYTMFVSIMKVLTTSFKSNFIATPISDNFTVFTERSFDDEKSLMKRKHISFLNTSDKDFDHFVVFEYRILNTKLSALSSMAKDFMDTMDSNMMDAVYKNAELRKNSLK